MVLAFGFKTHGCRRVPRLWLGKTVQSLTAAQSPEATIAQLALEMKVSQPCPEHSSQHGFLILRYGRDSLACDHVWRLTLNGPSACTVGWSQIGTYSTLGKSAWHCIKNTNELRTDLCLPVLTAPPPLPCSCSSNTSGVAASSNKAAI